MRLVNRSRSVCAELLKGKEGPGSVCTTQSCVDVRHLAIVVLRIMVAQTIVSLVLKKSLHFWGGLWATVRLPTVRYTSKIRSEWHTRTK